MLRAGRLRHRIVIEELLVTQDTDGAQVETWNPIAPALPAEIAPLSGRELIAAAATQSKLATRIVMRYRTDVKASMRARHRDVVYSIEAVVPDNVSGTRWLTLMCTSGVQFVNEA